MWYTVIGYNNVEYKTVGEGANIEYILYQVEADDESEAVQLAAKGVGYSSNFNIVAVVAGRVEVMPPCESGHMAAACDYESDDPDPGADEDTRGDALYHEMLENGELDE